MAKRYPKLVRLKLPKVPDDDIFIETLVWLLGKARNGEVKGYAMVCIIEGEDGQETIEASKAFTGEDRHHVLGAIRRMEINYMAREWPADEDNGAL